MSEAGTYVPAFIMKGILMVENITLKFSKNARNILFFVGRKQENIALTFLQIVVVCLLILPQPFTHFFRIILMFAQLF